MDAGPPIAAPNNPNLAGIKTPGSLSAKANNAANNPLAAFEALLSAHFAAVDQNAAIQSGAVAVDIGSTKLAPQVVSDDETTIVATEPGKSPKDTRELVTLDPNLSQAGQALAALLAGPQSKIITADITAVVSEATAQNSRARSIDALTNGSPLADQPLSPPFANPNLPLGGPPRLHSAGVDPKNDPIAANLILANSKNVPANITNSPAALATPIPYAAPPAPVLAQQAAVAQIAPKPDQASSELTYSHNSEFAAPKVGRVNAGRSQPVVGALTTGITGKSASAIAAGPARLESEISPEPQPSEPESVLVEAAPESEATTSTGQPTPQVVSNTHQLATAAVKSGPETVSNLAAQIVRNLEGRLTRFDVQLHPADLGRVDVRVEIGARGRVKASMSFENPQSAADLRSRSEELLRALESAGFDLSGGLSFDVAGDRGQGQSRPHQNSPDNGSRHQGRAFDAAMALATDPAGDPRTGRLDIYQARRAAGLDIRI